MTCFSRPSHAIRAALLACVLAPSAARAQSAAEVLRQVEAQARETTREINNYTVRMQVLEGTVTLYAARPSPNAPFMIQFGADGRLGPSMATLGINDALILAIQDPRMTSLRRNSLSYQGVAEVTGAPAHVIRATPPRGRSDDGGGPRSFTVHFDTATLLPRRLEMGPGAPGGTALQIVEDYDDYRTVQGLPVAFRRRLVMRGLRARADTVQMRALVDGLRTGLPSQPEAERERSRRMLEQLEGVLLRDELVHEVTVISAQVNQGPPAGVRLRPLAP
jgi:hypothetical protein